MLTQEEIDFAKNGDWEDVTSRSKNDKSAPKTFEKNIKGVRVRITCGHIAYKPSWIMYCEELNFNGTLLAKCKERAEQLVSIFS